MKKILSTLIILLAYNTYSQQNENQYGIPVDNVTVVNIPKDSTEPVSFENFISETSSVEESQSISNNIIIGEDADYIGATKGQFSVSLFGSATYTLPIEVPPGINGVQPNIAISYDSNGGNGIAGYGWNISGLSSINKVGSSKYFDGKNSVITYSSTDRFSLDGQRLILKSGVYGMDGAEYETQNYSNLKITSHGPTQSNYGPQYFKVQYPDGTIAYYGISYNAMKIGAIEGEKTRSNTVYALTYVTNPQNLVINYHYINDNGNLLISSIEYGYRTTQPLESLVFQRSQSSINFVYKNRNRSESQYVVGTENKLTKILDKIVVRGSTDVFKTYQLDYNITSLGYERLLRISEISGDETSTKIPVSFSYGSDTTDQNLITEENYQILDFENFGFKNLSSLNSNVITGDFSGNGRLGYLIYLTSGDERINDGNVLTIYNPNYNGTGVAKFVTQKFQNKPFTDVVTSRRINKDNILLPNTGWTTITDISPQGSLYKTYEFKSFIYMPDSASEIYQQGETITSNMYSKPEVRRQFLSGDIDGDGISEIIRTEHPLNFRDSGYNQYSTGIEVIDMNTGFVSTTTIPIGFNYMLSDINGDGRDELIVIRHQNILVYSNSGVGKTLSLYSNISAPDITFGKPVYTGDFNGDGNLDFVTPYSDKNGGNLWVFYIDMGNKNYKSFVKKIDDQLTFASVNRMPTTSGRHGSYNTIFMDFNNDGKTDVISLIDNITVGSNNSQTPILGTYYRVFENLKFDSESQEVIFSTVIGPQELPTGNIFFPHIVTANFNDKGYKNELALITDNKLKVYNFKKDNSTIQRLSNIKEFDITTKINYDVYDKRKNENKYIEDYIVPFTSFNSNLQQYPKVDLNVIPGLQLVTKVTYDVNQRALIGGSTTERKQLFSYADPESNLNGKGFLGFKGRVVTNVYKADQASKDQIKNITIFDLDNNGLVKEEYVAHSTDWYNFFTAPISFISKKINNYSITNFPNKVFKALNTETLVTEGLTSKNRKIINTFDSFSNPLSVLEEVSVNGEMSTLFSQITYDNNPVNNNYYLGRPLSKLIKMNNIQTSKEVYTYSNNLVTSITKEGAQGSIPITETNDYDVFGNIIKKTISASDIQPRIASYVYDSSGRYLEKSTDVEGLQTTYNYNKSNGWLLSETNPYGLVSSFNYNAFGMLISEKDYLGNETSYIYKTNGSIGSFSGRFIRKETFLSDGKKTKSTTNAWGNKTSESYTDIEGNWINQIFSYDTQDRLISKSEPYSSNASLYTTFEYDKFGRIIKSVLPTGREITSSYNGLTTTINDGVKEKIETKNVNDQTKKIVDNGQIINYNYNPIGTLKNTNYDGTIISFEYDAWGRKTKMTDPSAGEYSYQYNSIGDLLRETTPNGITTISYDETGKIKTTSYPDYNIVYNYNADKLPSNIITNSLHGHYVEYFTYDNLKRIITKKYTTAQNFTYTYNYTYDALGRQLTEEKMVTGANGSDSFKTKNIFKNGYLWKLQNANNSTDLKVYNTFNIRGQVTSFELANGLKTERSYDAFGFLTQNKVLKGDIQQFNSTNTWDVQRGNLTSRSNSLFTDIITETFQYDSFDRLTNFITNQGSPRARTIAQEQNNYDDKGRILNNNVGDYSYDSTKAYQLQNVNNLNDLAYYQSNPLQQVTYNAKKLPLSIKQQGKENIYFNYDGFGNRMVMYFGNEAADYTASIKTRYYAPTGDIEIDFDKATNKYIVNIFVDGDPYSASIVQRKENNATNLFFLHRDYLGSILAITNNTGNIVEKRHFDAWGNILLVQDGQNNNLQKLTFLERGYTGHEHLQGVELINMNARLYDPKLHRFLAPDNFIQDSDNSQNYNRYAYAFNNPLKYTDPSGEIIVPVLIGIGIGILTNGINNSTNNQPFFRGAVTAGIIGGVSGLVSAGIGGYVASFSQATAFQSAFISGTAHAFAGGITSHFTANNFLSGFVSGGISSAVSSSISSLGIGNYYTRSAAIIGGGTLSGGLVSLISGGNLWNGIRQGFITSALNHVAHESVRKIVVNKNLRDLGIDPNSVPNYDRETVYDLIKKDPTLLDLFTKSNSPDIQVGGVYGKSKNSGGATEGVYKTKSVNFIGINKSAFRNYYYLYQVVGHELYHAYQIVSGYAADAVKTYGGVKGEYLIEAGAYRWNYRMDPTNDFFSGMLTKMLQKFYEK